MPAKKRPAAADPPPQDDEEAPAEEEEEEPAATESPAKKAKAAPKPRGKAAAAPESAAGTDAEAPPAAAPAAAASASSSSAPPSADDPLGLTALFEGGGYGAEWEAILRPVITAQPNAAFYIGPSRDKRMVPVRELTFQALKPNPPSRWRVVSFGQSPYPRLESATGIAHFDNTVDSWASSRFGAVVTVRCIIKAAAMCKYGVPKTTSVPELRTLISEKNVVGPAEWFQAMLTQGVLFMNAACTLLRPQEDKSVRAGTVVKEHTKFWSPVIAAIVDAILSECRKNGKGIVFTWWGTESLETKKFLDKQCFKNYADVMIEHINHKNPAAMADAFCDDPNIFGRINKALVTLGHKEIDWLPSHGWKDSLATGGASADRMGDFIAETQALHKMYLERLKDGLDGAPEELADITGVAQQPLVTLVEALKALKLEVAAARSVEKAKGMTIGELTVEEAASVHMYTTNHLYKKLNEALRNKDRKKVGDYFLYLRLLLSALSRMPFSTAMLYRGVALDLASQYKEGSQVTWWAVSSCTPDLKVAKGFGGGAKVWTLFNIEPLTSVGIKHLSEYKHEEEFVLAPGTTFTVTKVRREGTCVEIHMKELDGPSRVR